MTLTTSFRRISTAAFLCAALLRADDFQGARHKLPYDAEPINYEKTQPHSPIEELQKKIDSGEVKLNYDEKYGWLPALLEHLKIPQNSQTLVFSKTSLQRSLISPDNPRALYFNDDIYLGYVPGAPLMEILATDPDLGGVFYTLELQPADKPRFTRATDCNSCHGDSRSLGVPGPFVRSIATDSTGELEQTREVRYVNHRTPIAERWGGWYVTGKHGDMTHRGNLIGADRWDAQEEKPSNKPGGNLTKLDKFFDQKLHPGRGSDIVALLVLEHQAQMHNYITRLNYEARIMLKTYGHLRYLRPQITSFLQYLLMTEEAPLTAPVTGNPDYAKWFQAQGPRDKQGRSLRDLDLTKRLFKHPCSYLIYSPAFDAMQKEMRDLLLQRLLDILTSRDLSGEFAALTDEDRRTILEILVETKPNLPPQWKAAIL